MEGGVNKFIEASDTEFSDLEDSSMEIEGTKRWLGIDMRPDIASPLSVVLTV